MSDYGHHVKRPGLRWLGRRGGVDVYQRLRDGRQLHLYPGPGGGYARIRSSWVFPDGTAAVVQHAGRVTRIYHPGRSPVSFGAEPGLTVDRGDYLAMGLLGALAAAVAIWKVRPSANKVTAYDVHVARRVPELTAQGLTPAQAMAQAKREWRR